MRKILGALLSLMLMAALFCVPSFAADPVTPEQDVVRVTLPTAITVTDNRDGTFTTPDTTITNNGKADVKVSGITVEPSSGWTLVDWDSLADYTATGEQFISALFYGAAVDASGAAAGESLPAIASGESTTLDCDFWLSPQVDPLNQQVATAVVTIALDGNGGLAYITVDTPPDTVDYLPGDDFDPAGMEVTAHYYDGSTADVTDYVAVEDGADLALGQDTVTVTYTEDDTTVEAAVDITVMAPINVTVTDFTNSGATLTAPSDGWWSGGNSFSVTCTSPCVVLLIQDGEVTELSCVQSAEASDTYVFTGEDMKDGAEIQIAYRADADLDYGLDFAEGTTINQYWLGLYEPREIIQLYTMDADRDGDVDSDDVTAVHNYLLGFADFGWNVGERPFKVTFYNHAGSNVYHDDWHEGENVLTAYDLYEVTLIRDGESTVIPYVLDDSGSYPEYQYTLNIQYGDTVTVNRTKGSAVFVYLTDYTDGAATITKPDVWVMGENNLTVSCDMACAVGVIRDGVLTEVPCTARDDGSYLFVVDAEHKDEVVVALRGDADLDGGVDFADATTINQYMLGIYEMDEVQKMVSDVELLYGISFSDATAINQYLLGLNDIKWYLEGTVRNPPATGHIDPEDILFDIVPELTQGSDAAGDEYNLIADGSEQDVTFQLGFTGVEQVDTFAAVIDYSALNEYITSNSTPIGVIPADASVSNSYLGSLAQSVSAKYGPGQLQGVTSTVEGSVILYWNEMGVPLNDPDSDAQMTTMRLGLDADLQPGVYPIEVTVYQLRVREGEEPIVLGNAGTHQKATVNLYVADENGDVPGVGDDEETTVTINKGTQENGTFTVPDSVKPGESFDVIVDPADGYTPVAGDVTVSGPEGVTVGEPTDNGDGTWTYPVTVPADVKDPITVDLTVSPMANSILLLPIEVNVLDETEGAAIVTAPEAGWVAGENTFTVTSSAPVAVYHVPVDGEPVELTGETLDDTTTRYTVMLAEGDSIRVAFAETEPVPETIEVNVLDETEGAAVLTGPEEGWVTGENTFTVSGVEAVSVYHVAADTTVTELTGEAVDDTTTRYTVTLAEGDSIRMELAATEPELPEEQLPVEEAPAEEVPGDPENQTPETNTEPSDPVSGAPAEEEPPIEEAPPVEESEAEDTDTVPEPEAPVEEPETDGTEPVTEPEAPETSDESALDTSDETGEGLQTSEPSPAGEENTVEDVQAGGAESKPAMLPDDETYEAGALAA